MASKRPRTDSLAASSANPLEPVIALVVASNVDSADDNDDASPPPSPRAPRHRTPTLSSWDETSLHNSSAWRRINAVNGRSEIHSDPDGDFATTTTFGLDVPGGMMMRVVTYIAASYEDRTATPAVVSSTLAFVPGTTVNHFARNR